MGLGIRETFVGVVFVCFCVLSNIVMGFVCVIYLVSVDGRGGKDEVFKNDNF